MAEKKISTLTNDKNNAIVDNEAGEITPAVDRDVRQDIIDSMLNKASGNPEQDVNSPVNFTGGIKQNGILGDILTGAAQDIEGEKTFKNGVVIESGGLDIAGTTVVDEILDEDNLSSDSDTALATQQSIKAYVDSSADTLQDVYSTGSDVDIDNTQGAIKLSRGVGITNAAFNIVPSTVTPSANLADGDFHVEDGTIFLYDLARTKFLSSGTPVALQFGKNNGAGNEFVRFGGDARDGNSGAILPWDATIVAITLKGSNNTGQSFDIEVDGVDVETLVAASSTISDDTLDLDVDAGQTINLFAQADGTEVNDPYAIIFVKRRKV